MVFGFVCVGLVLKGFSGVGGCMLYEDWLEVEVVDVVVGLGRESGKLGEIEGASRCMRERTLAMST